MPASPSSSSSSFPRPGTETGAELRGESPGAMCASWQETRRSSRAARAPDRPRRRLVGIRIAVGKNLGDEVWLLRSPADESVTGHRQRLLVMERFFGCPGLEVLGSRAPRRPAPRSTPPAADPRGRGAPVKTSARARRGSEDACDLLTPRRTFAAVRPTTRRGDCTDQAPEGACPTAGELPGEATTRGRSFSPSKASTVSWKPLCAWPMKRPGWAVRIGPLHHRPGAPGKTRGAARQVNLDGPPQGKIRVPRAGEDGGSSSGGSLGSRRKSGCAPSMAHR